MIAKVRGWIVRQLTLGHFATRKDVVRRSVILAAKISLLALCLNVVLEAFMAEMGLLPYAFADALKTIFILSPTISFIIGTTAYMVVGFAIYDLSRERAAYEQMSFTDELSGLANRRAFLDAVEECDRQDKVLILFDVDHFKVINDTYGHPAGDAAIIVVADVLRAVFTRDAIKARIGGEEFAVLLANRSLAEGMALAELARMRIEALKLELPGGQINFTISGGVTDLIEGDGFTCAFSRADRALYAAKRNGRNRIVPALPVADEAFDLAEDARHTGFRDEAPGAARKAAR
ncbi:GGDEF domain-containing protein [Pseudohoeflea suaedae]|nr:GGDEF domain-containing protein [Pseudohoeflea suaedae]